MKKLLNIQAELKAPKGQYNKFGNYKYRSCEDILQAVKPLLKKEGCILTMCDTIKEIGGRVYVAAEARIIDVNDSSQAHDVVAYAREAESKKGMDAAQITGAASSYARKYALNGLFAIDDGNDPDGQNNTEPENNNSEDEKKKLHSIVDQWIDALTKRGHTFTDQEVRLIKSGTIDQIKANITTLSQMQDK
jgi:hypothetical protein